MATEDDSDVPETGAVFTYGKSKFGDNSPGKFWVRGDKVLRVCCGDEHTALVTESGRLFVFGINEWGQLGVGHNKTLNKPTRVKSLKSEKVRQVACGRNHTIIATESGRVYGCGSNSDSQLGTGVDEIRVEVPVVISSLPSQKYKKIACGVEHTIALSESGDVWVWGSSSEGQLGLGKKQEAATPTKLSFPHRAAYVAAGYYHTAVVTDDGRLFTCGEDEGGKLGLGENSITTNVLKEVTSINGRVATVACGGKHTVAITERGLTYTFGEGSNGQLGHGTTILSATDPQESTWLRDIKMSSAACGENHSAVISVKGQLYSFGDGRHGKLALGDENFANHFKPMLVQRFKKFKVEEVSCGGCHTVVLAAMREESEEFSASGDSMEEEVHDIYKPPHNREEAIRRSHDLTSSWDGTGSISARNRRRETNNVNDNTGALNRTLPPLTSSFNSKSPSPLSRTITMETSQLTNSRIPPHEGVRDKDSEASVSEDDSDDQMVKRKQAESQHAAPHPKPRVLPHKATSDPQRSDDSGAGSDDDMEEGDDDDEEEDEDDEQIKPVPIPRKGRGNVDREEIARENVYVTQSAKNSHPPSYSDEEGSRKKQSKQAKPQYSRKPLPDSDDDEDDMEEVSEDEKKKARRSKYETESEGEDLARRSKYQADSEEEDDKTTSKNKKGKKNKKEKKKNKKADREPLTDEDDEEMRNTAHKKKKKKEKKKKDIDADLDEEEAEELKKTAKKKKKEKKEKKKDKKKIESEEEADEDDEESQPEDAEDKEEKTEEKTEEKKEEKKKSKLCTIL